MLNNSINELNFNEIDRVGGGVVPLIALAPAAWAALEGAAIGATLYAAVKLALD